jgi:2-polyprenyl-6-hydroxyphenyl methylase / 3-demethylubiquinone-9 3-methyltransferase
MNDLTIYNTWSPEWWDGSARWLRTLHNMVPARLRYFDEFVTTWEGLDVLDLGCGGGFMSEALSKRGADVTAIDPAAEAIATARAHAATQGLKIDYREGVGEDLGIPDASVDVVVCVDVLEHVASVPKTLDEIGRVLRPGGTFAFDTINRNWLARLAVVTMAEDIFGLLPKGAHDPDLFIKPTDLRFELKQRGFENIQFAGLGPTGINRKLDFTFGRVPTTLIQYMGVAIRC